MRAVLIAVFVLLVAPVVIVLRRPSLPSLPSLPGFSSQTASAELPDLTAYVDPFIGTAGAGNTFPGADAPFGMVQWSPETTAGGLFRPGGYNAGDLIIRGFGLTHLSGAGCVAFANVPFMPTVRPIVAAPQPNGSPYSDRFLLNSERAAPGFYSVQLNSGIRTDLTVSTHAGIARISYPPTGPATMLVDAGNGANGTSNVDGTDASTVRVRGNDELVGSATAGRFCQLSNHFTVYFAARFDHPFIRFGTWTGKALRSGSRSAAGRRTGSYLTFDTSTNPLVKVKVGLSYVSVADAEQNLAAEMPGWDFNAIHRRVQAEWNTWLNRVQVEGGSIAERRIFYTALYHCLLAPSTFSDVNGEYIGFDGKVHAARGSVQYANFSGWDIYRSEVQLLAWLAPRQTSDMMQSLVRDAEQGGWLPKWPVANDYTGEMDGDSADPIIADAIAFGADRFDVQSALLAMVKGATQSGTGPGRYVERPDLPDYLKLGWTVPQTGGWGAASQTLEYLTDDFAIAQVARHTGNLPTVREFLRRASNWSLLLDPRSGYLRARNADGTFSAAFNPAATVGYVEGNAAQYLWMVPYDLPGLFRKLGGVGAAVQRLDALFARFANSPNQPHYWAGNEPELEVAWEYDSASRPWRTQETARRIELQQYSAARNGIPGNDDLGALSSWYVWATIGLYPEVPGVGGFAIGSPLFPQITLHVAGGTTVTIQAPAASSGTPYVRTLLLGGRPYRRTWLPLSRLRRSPHLSFDLASVPYQQAFG